MQQARSIFEEIVGPEHPSTASALHELGRLHMEQGDLYAARLFLERALAIRRRVLGDQDALVAQTAASLAELLTAAGEREAVDALVQALYMLVDV
eukprot:tig00020675_g12614.t1